MNQNLVHKIGKWNGLYQLRLLAKVKNLDNILEARILVE